MTSHIETLLKASVTIEAQKKVINSQADQIKVLKTTLRIAQLREAKRMRGSESLPALLRLQAG